MSIFVSVPLWYTTALMNYGDVQKSLADLLVNHGPDKTGKLLNFLLHPDNAMVGTYIPHKQ